MTTALEEDAQIEAEVKAARMVLAVQAGNEMIAFARAITASPAEGIMGLLIAARAICAGATETPFDDFYRAACELPLGVEVSSSDDRSAAS